MIGDAVDGDVLVRRSALEEEMGVRGSDPNRFDGMRRVVAADTKIRRTGNTPASPAMEW